MMHDGITEALKKIGISVVATGSVFAAMLGYYQPRIEEKTVEVFTLRRDLAEREKESMRMKRIIEDLSNEKERFRIDFEKEKELNGRLMGGDGAIFIYNPLSRLAYDQSPIGVFRLAPQQAVRIETTTGYAEIALIALMSKASKVEIGGSKQPVLYGAAEIDENQEMFLMEEGVKIQMMLPREEGKTGERFEIVVNEIDPIMQRCVITINPGD